MSKSHILFSYDNHPLTKTNQNAFQFSKNEISIINHLAMIMKNYDGIYLFGGNKGTGKTSIIEQARVQYLYNEKNTEATCFCKISLPLHTDNLCLRILHEVSNSNALQKGTDLHKRLSVLIGKFENSIKIKDVYSTNSSIKAEISQEINYTNELSIEPSFPALPVIGSLFKGKWSNKKGSTVNSDKSQQQQMDTTYELDRKYIEENMSSDFIKFMQDVTSKYNMKIIIVLDELDKLPKEEILNFLYNNKILLLESDILFFLICDLQQTIFLQDAHAQYFNEILYLSELSLEDFIIITRQLELSENIEDALSLLYVTKGNHRSLIHCYMHDFGNQNDKELKKKSYVLAFCLETDFFRKLPLQYRSILVYFLVDTLDTLQLLSTLTETQLEKIKDEFLLYNSIQSVKINFLLDKCISLLKTSIPVSSFFRLNMVPFSKEKTISDVLDKFLVELFSENICIFNNNLFTFQSIVSYFCNFELHKNQLENEYWKQNQEILGSCINWDRLLKNRLLNYLDVNKPNDSVSLSQDEIITATKPIPRIAITPLKNFPNAVIG